MIHAFTLGHQAHISEAEIIAVCSRLAIDFSIVSRNKSTIFIQTTEQLDAPQLINQLGGTVAISEQQEQLIGKTIEQKVSQYLFEQQPTGKIVFGLEGISPKVALKIKKNLKQLGRSVRYVQVKNTASIIHNGLVKKAGHIRIIDSKIFVTRAVQDIESFSMRDYERPGTDSKSGMLPPKLARIMINLTQKRHKSSRILDPYCGSGTVLVEAAVLGFQHIIGSDLSEKAIDDSLKNLHWIQEKKNLEFKQELFIQDVQHLTQVVDKNSVDAIVFEPYMGKPLHGNEPLPVLKKQAKELEQLFIRAFQQCHAVLHPAGALVGIIPRFRWRNEWVTIDIQSELKKMGFEIVLLSKKEPYLLYHREGQHVGREIWKLKKS